MAKQNAPSTKDSRPGRLRIVAGKWRSRLLPIADEPGLRPTPSRVRETLFNWLSADIHGSRCLDLFAGTGALGFEALSRGAASATMIENSPVAADVLRQSAEILGAGNARIECADALKYLNRPTEICYDIVFLDPPFAADLVEQCCHLLQSNGWLAKQAAIYVEQDKAKLLPALPTGWHVSRDKIAGHVRFALARTNPEE